MPAWKIIRQKLHISNFSMFVKRIGKTLSTGELGIYIFTCFIFLIYFHYSLSFSCPFVSCLLVYLCIFVLILYLSNFSKLPNYIYFSDFTCIYIPTVRPFSFFTFFFRFSVYFIFCLFILAVSKGRIRRILSLYIKWELLVAFGENSKKFEVRCDDWQ